MTLPRSPPTLLTYSARDSDRACTFRFMSSRPCLRCGAHIGAPQRGPLGEGPTGPPLGIWAPTKPMEALQPPLVNVGR